MKDVMAFFGPWKSTAEFSKEWKALSEQDKADLKKGLADGSLTY